MKECAECGEEKGPKEFAAKLQNPDGLKDRCRECDKRISAERRGKTARQSVEIECGYCGGPFKKKKGEVNKARSRGYKLYCGKACRVKGRQATISAGECYESQALPWGPTIDTGRYLQTRSGCEVQIIDKAGEEPWALRGYYWRYEKDGVGNWLLVKHSSKWGWDGRWGELGIEDFELDLIYQEEA